jgi:hypothetical protein
MGKRKARGRQHHDGNQTSGDLPHTEKYMQFPPHPTANRFYWAKAPLFRSGVVRAVDVCFWRKESPKQLFDLREDAFHLAPAKGAQRLTLDVAK